MKWKELGWKMCAIGAFTAVTTGCSGIAASGGVSPLSFLLPGLVMDESTGTPPEDVVIVSSVRPENNS